MAKINAPEKLQKGDIILYAGTDWVSRAINLFDNSEYSHASIYMGNEQIMESTFSNGGVRINDLHEGAKKYDKLSIKRHANASDLDMQFVLDQAWLFNGSRYDVAQILQLALIGISRKLSFYDAIQFRILKKVLELANRLSMNLFRNGDDTTVCSEFVYRCYDDVVLDDAEAIKLYKIKLNFEPTLLVGARNRDNKSSYIANGSMISMFYGDMSSESDQKSNQELIDVNLLESFKTLRDEDFILEELITNAKNSYNHEPIQLKDDQGSVSEFILQDDVAEIEALLDEFESKPKDLKGIRNVDVNVKNLLISDIKSNMDEFMIRTSPAEMLALPQMVTGPDFLNQIPKVEQVRIKQEFMVQREHFVTSQDLFWAKNLVDVDDAVS